MNNKTGILVAIAFLMAMANVADLFGSTLANNIKTGKVKLNTSTLLVRKNISNTGGTHDVIDANTRKEKGVSTLDGNKLNNEAILFDRVAIGYAKGAEATSAGAQAYGLALPTELRNAFLVIKQNNRIMLHEPIANFTVKGTPQAPDEYFLELLGWEYISDVDTFDIQIEYPVGVSLDAADAANNHFIEVRLGGAKTVNRS